MIPRYTLPEMAAVWSERGKDHIAHAFVMVEHREQRGVEAAATVAVG